MTKPQGYWQSAAEAAFCLAFLLLPDYQDLLFAGIERMLFATLMSCLLIFLVVHSTDIFRVVAACLMVFASRLAPSLKQGARAANFVSFAVPCAPILPQRWQRPPPLFS